jgi:hypothetical protein
MVLAEGIRTSSPLSNVQHTQPTISPVATSTVLKTLELGFASRSDIRPLMAMRIVRGGNLYRVLLDNSERVFGRSMRIIISLQNQVDSQGKFDNGDEKRPCILRCNVIFISLSLALIHLSRRDHNCSIQVIKSPWLKLDCLKYSKVNVC